MMNNIFKISPNWDCATSLEELMKNARFIFTRNGHNGKRPMIVLHQPIGSQVGVDCIEISYDRYGLTTGSVAIFNDSWGSQITDSSQEYIQFIKDFLIAEGASEHILN